MPFCFFFFFLKGSKRYKVSKGLHTYLTLLASLNLLPMRLCSDNVQAGHHPAMEEHLALFPCPNNIQTTNYKLSLFAQVSNKRSSLDQGPDSYLSLWKAAEVTYFSIIQQSYRKYMKQGSVLVQSLVMFCMSSCTYLLFGSYQ